MSSGPKTPPKNSKINGQNLTVTKQRNRLSPKQLINIGIKTQRTETDSDLT